MITYQKEWASYVVILIGNATSRHYSTGNLKIDFRARPGIFMIKKSMVPIVRSGLHAAGVKYQCEKNKY